MTSGAVRRPAAPVPAGDDGAPSGVTPGRPPLWLVLTALVATAAITADLLSRGVLERLDLRVSEVVGTWDLEDSAAYPLVWLLTQFGGRVTLLAVLAALVGTLAWRRRTLLPLVRVVLALAMLTGVVYGFKYGTGRTAPAYPGSFFHRDGESYPSGHVANAVLIWGVARWQAVEYGLPPVAQRVLRWLSVAGPAVTGVAMVALDFHWVTDALAGGTVGIVLLGVVHLLDVTVLSRWVGGRSRTGAPGRSG